MARRGVRPWALVGAAATVTATGAACFYYRPLPDPGSDKEGPRRSGPWTSAASLSDEAHAVPWLVSLGRHVVTPVVITLSRTFLLSCGRFDIRRDDNYEAFLQAALRRPAGTALITISNHRSMFDDPAVLSSLLPFIHAVQPRYLRFNVCSQEICFNPNLPGAVHAFFGAGKSLPIWRGGGINQRLLLDYTRHAAAGEWCHLFPEGGVWQDSVIGGRLNKSGAVALPSSITASSGADGRGEVPVPAVNRLKWGIGKVIAHCPTAPVVVPFFHSGMQTVIPMDPASRQLTLLASITVFGRTLTLPRLHGGHEVTVRFGAPLRFDDLIGEHERRHGRLVKILPSRRLQEQQQQEQRAGVISTNTTSTTSTSSISTSTSRGTAEDFHSYWDSSEAECELYRKITLRIEEALLQLNLESEREERTREGRSC